MNASAGPIAPHLSIDRLLDYWLGDADAPATDAMDEHLMHCDACGAALDELIGLGAGVREAFRGGAVSAVLTGPFVERLAAQGVRVREYRLARNGSVNCTVAPDDDLLVTRLEAPLQGVLRLDVLAQLSFAPGMQQRFEDIPFDPQAGEVLYVTRIADVRRMPAHEMQVTLLAVEAGSARELGHYTFHHRPWAGDGA